MLREQCENNIRLGNIQRVPTPTGNKGALSQSKKANCLMLVCKHQCNNELWAVTNKDKYRLGRKEANVLHWTCNVSVQACMTECKCLETKFGHRKHQTLYARNIIALVWSCGVYG